MIRVNRNIKTAPAAVLLGLCVWTSGALSSSAETLVYQQGVEISLNGVKQGVDYAGTHDAELREDAADSNYDEGTGSSDPEFKVDNNGPGLVSQVVLRFDDVFDLIPANSTIESATLFFDIDDTGSNMSLYRLADDFIWSETLVTWNNFGSVANNGVEVGVETVGSAKIISGTGNKVNVDVTADVQAWFSGASNNGWAFLPGGNNPVDFDASENSDDEDRPSLTIVYHVPQNMVLAQDEEIVIEGVGQGVNFTGTHDAELRENDAAANHDEGSGGVNPMFSVSDGGPGTEAQVVMKFDGMFDALPGDAVIFAATLSIDIDETGDDLSLYRLADGTAWDETTVTWNSIGTVANDGVQVGVETSGAAATVDGNGDKVVIDVTADVLAWFDGATNNGWVFVGGADAVGFNPSEAATAAARPTLTISFNTALSDTLVIERGPYLQMGSSSEMTVRWRTSGLGDSVVRYGTVEGVLDQVESIIESEKDHIVKLTGLLPDTRYYYQVDRTAYGTSQVVSTPAADTYFETAPVAGSLDPTSIWVIGDSGTAGSKAEGVYTGFRNLFGPSEVPQTDVWLMLGDNAYSSGTDSEFQEAVFEIYPELLRNSVLWSTIGNHEARSAGGAPYLDIFSFPENGESGGVASTTELYYSFDRANIHFICLDSQTGGNYNDAPGGGGMYDWLEADLQACDKDWIIAFFHHGPYTKGSHNSDTEGKHIQMRKFLVPLLESYGVDLVLSGHSHQYERTPFINGHHGPDSGSETFSAANIVDGGNGSEIGDVDGSGAFISDPLLGDGAYHKPLATANDGAVYAIAGASGKISNWDNGSSALVNPAPHDAHLVTLRLLGSMLIEVDGFTLNAKYIDSCLLYTSDAADE